MTAALLLHRSIGGSCRIDSRDAARKGEILRAGTIQAGI